MKYSLIALGILVMCSCKQTSHPVNEITKVELARSGAWSDFGGAVSVDSALNYNYYGKYRDVKTGYFTGKINPQFWDTLNRRLEAINFKTIPTTDGKNTVDVNYYELIISWRNSKRRIRRMRDNTSHDSVLNVLEWLNGSYKNVRLKQVKDSIQFESTLQYSPRLDIKIEQLKFPPPIKRRQHIN